MNDWSKFDRVMRDLEWANKKGRLSSNAKTVLENNECWKNSEPYCTYDHFTYTLSDKQIKEILTLK